jgi:hypothetical protein
MWGASDGKGWTTHFARENSGTYNNEYVILDTKLWKPGEPLNPNLMWMIEQMPGTTVSASVTEILRNKTFFESINTPQFPLIWKLADYDGQAVREPLRKDFFSFDNQIRDKLIRRDAPNLNTYESFQAFMRYNDYLHDPLMIIPDTNPPQREPAQGILSRYDLRPENGTNWGQRRHFGGVDAKTASVNHWLKTHTWDARLSPTSDEKKGVPVFDFANWPKISHTGIPARWDFGWIHFPPGDLCGAISKNDEDKCIDVEGCGFCIPDQKCMNGTKDGPSEYFGGKCEVGWSYKKVQAPWVLPVIISVTAATVVFVASLYAVHFWRVRKRNDAGISQFQTL